MKNLCYTRKQKANTKLSEKDIEEIKRLRARGCFLREIAKMFGVSHNTIYWHTSQKHRDYFNKWTKENVKVDTETDTLRKKKYVNRKKIFFPNFWKDARQNWLENI